MLAQKSVSASSNYDTFTWLTKIKLTSVRNHEGKMKKKEDLTIAAAQLERERERESERRKKKKKPLKLQTKHFRTTCKTTNESYLL